MQGWIKDYRKELKSDIWQLPPLYHRVWQWLKYQVNHEQAIIPLSDGTKLQIKRGQHLTSIRNIAQGVGWFEGVLWKEPNPKTIAKIIEWLDKNKMITIDRGRGNRQYTLITLINYGNYQGSIHDEVTVNGEGTGEGTGYKQECLKNDIKNEEEYNTSFHSKTMDMFLHSFNSNFKDAIEDALARYYRSYEHYTGKKHPILKREQLERVYDVFESALSEYGDLYDMIEEFFETVKNTDFNVNHFATAGILEILVERVR